MNIDDIEKYCNIFDRLVELFPFVESALEDRNTTDEFEEFMIEGLDSVYSTVEELIMSLYLKEDLSKLILQIK